MSAEYVGLIEIMHPDIGVINKLYFVIFATFKKSMTLNLAPRLFKVILAAIESPYTTLCKPLIVTFTQSSTVSEILPVLYVQSPFFHTPIVFRLKFVNVSFGVDS